MKFVKLVWAIITLGSAFAAHADPADSTGPGRLLGGVTARQLPGTAVSGGGGTANVTTLAAGSFPGAIGGLNSSGGAIIVTVGAGLNNNCGVSASDGTGVTSFTNGGYVTPSLIVGNNVSWNRTGGGCTGYISIQAYSPSATIGNVGVGSYVYQSIVSQTATTAVYPTCTSYVTTQYYFRNIQNVIVSSLHTDGPTAVFDFTCAIYGGGGGP